MRCRLPNDQYESVARVQYQLKKSLSLAFGAGKKNYFIEGDIFSRVDSILLGDNRKGQSGDCAAGTIETGRGLEFLFLNEHADYVRPRSNL